MNFPSFLAFAIPSAATVPSPGMLFNGGLIAPSSTKNFVACDLYKSIGKNVNPLSYISNTSSNIEYMFLSFTVALFPCKSISFILFFTFSFPNIMQSLSNSSALIEKNAA